MVHTAIPVVGLVASVSFDLWRWLGESNEFVSIDAWYEEPTRAPPIQPALELTYIPITEEVQYVSEFADA